MSRYTSAAAALVAMALGWLVVFPRVFRRHRSLLLSIGPLRGLLNSYNNMARKIAGTPWSSWGLLTHVGRRSGRTYQTSLGALPYSDGFLLPLGYGTHSDWYRNLMAAGTATLAWNGCIYQLERPELISGSDVVRAWSMRDRLFLRLAGIHDFVWLRTAEEPELTMQHTAS
jgi:deazaflavin-dependent oxidoreductase (nitroreductase family)